MSDCDQKRIVWLDNFKSIGIVTIVLFHAGVDVKLFSYFFVPMFYFASGFTFKNFGLHLCKKLQRFYFPFIIVNIIHILLHNPLCFLGIYAAPLNSTQILNGVVRSVLFDITENLNAPCWFLFSMFCVSVSYYSLFHFIRFLFKKYSDLIMTFTCLGLFVIGVIWADKLSSILWGNCAIITNILTGVAFYHLGYFFSFHCFIFGDIAGVTDFM